MFNDIIGHQAVKTFLEKSVVSNRVSHAYLFLGPAGVGKMALARVFAETLLHNGGAVFHNLEAHPDVMILGKAIDEKTNEPKQTINIEQIRELRERLFFSSLFPSWKIAIIDEAEAMTTEASNALLKTLEEPRGQTVIILIARDARRILQTVRSRSQLVRFSLVARNEIEKGLEARGAKKPEAKRIAKIVRGRPGVALSFLLNEAGFTELLQTVRERRTLLQEPIYARLRWLEAEIKGKKGKEVFEELQLWREIFRDELLRELEAPELLTFESNSKENDQGNRGIKYQLWRLRRLIESEDAARYHVDPRLAFEHFLAI